MSRREFLKIIRKAITLRIGSKCMDSTPLMSIPNTFNAVMGDIPHNLMAPKKPVKDHPSAVNLDGIKSNARNLPCSKCNKSSYRL